MPNARPIGPVSLEMIDRHFHTICTELVQAHNPTTLDRLNQVKRLEGFFDAIRDAYSEVAIPKTEG